MSLRKIVHQLPAYNVFEGKSLREGYKPGDALYIKGRRYTLGDCIDHAIRNCKDPIAAVERAQKNGHSVYWLYQQAPVLSSSPYSQPPAFAVEPYDHIKYHGREFVVLPASNDNYDLEEVS